MRRLFVTAVSLLLLSNLNAQKFFRSITVDHTKVPNTNQVSFPVLVSGTYSFLKTLPNGGKVSNPNGYDIQFTADSFGVTKLSWEIERYNAATGELVAWVNTDLSPATDKVIYMQYGDPSITTFQGNIAATWNSGYQAVYHMKDGTILNAGDATSNAINGTITGATATSGQIGGSANLSGSSQYIDLGNNLGVTGDITISAWIKPNSFASESGILSKTAWNQPKPYDYKLWNSSGLPTFFRGNGSGNDHKDATTAPTLGVWSYITVTVSGSTIAHFLNGAANGGGTMNIGGAGGNGTNDAFIGTREDKGPMFNGGIDEIRVSNIARSADWIKTEFNSQSSPSTFYAVGAERPAGNQSPTANAGTNQTIIFPNTTSATLTGSGSDPDGTVNGYAWSLVSGPNTPGYSAQAAATTNVTGLIVGTYIFKLTVTDNLGATGTSTVTVQVNQNQSPTANAGSNQFVILPANSASLSGSGSDPDGTVNGYAWSLVSGPNTPGYSAQASASTNVTGLIAGTYIFKLTVTDNLGATGTSTVTVQVNATNTPPNASAGANQNIFLPTTTVTLNGSGTDPDGTVNGYAWSLVSGTNSPTIGGASSPTANISGLVQGSYVFRLTVTDNLGATGTSDVLVTVNAALPPSRFFRSITVDHTKVPNTAQLNFPVLVSGNFPFLKTVANGGKVNNANGYDILFTTDTAGTAKLNWEIEKYNPVTGDLIAWVKLDQLSPAADAVFYLQYGDNTITAFQGNVVGTWTNGFQAVYHLKDGTTLNANDVTSNGINGTITGATATTGQIDGAANLSGSSQYIDLGNNLGITGDVTISAWVKPNSFAAENGILSKTAWNQPKPYDYKLWNASGLPTFFRGNGSGNDHKDGTTAPALGVWSYLSVTVTGSTIAHFLNGAANGGGTMNIGGAGGNGTNDAFIGTREDKGPMFNGGLDEIRVSNIARSADWVKTEYNNQSSPATFYAVGAEKSAVAQAPVVNAGPNQTVPGTTVKLSGSATSPNGAISTYTWSKVSGPNTPTIVTPSLDSTTVTGMVQGTYVFRLTATDNTNASGTGDVAITVTGANQPPVANAGSNQTITIPASSVTLNGSGSNDPDGTIASYSWTQFSGPVNSAVIASPTSASTNVTGLIQGTYVFRLVVTDNSGATGTSDVTITINGDISEPVITTNNPQTISGTTASLTSNATSTFPINSTKWTKFSVPGQTVKRITAVGSSTTAGNGLPYDSVYINRLSAYYKSQGLIDTIYNLSVSGSSVFDVNITAALNFGAPVLLANYPSNAYGGSTYSVHDICVKYQEIADSCTLRGVQFYTTGTQPRNDYNPADRAKLNVINDSLRLRFGARFIDFLTLSLNTYDNSIKVDYAQADGIHENAAGHERFFQLVRAANMLQNTFSSASTIGSPNSGATNISNLTPGVHKFQVSAFDGRGMAANAVASITVNILNQPPVANAGLDRVITAPKDSVNLSGAASTDDHHIVAYLWSKIGTEGGTLGTPTASTASFTGLTPGVYLVQLQVTDDSSAIAKDTVQITVNPPLNHPPVANAGLDRIITSPKDSVNLSGAGSTDDHNIVSYLWSKVGTEGGTLGTPTASTASFTGLTPGVYLVQLQVTDDSSAIAKDTVQITVNPPLNHPPVANAGLDRIITSPKDSVNLSGAGSTDDHNIVSYLWSKVGTEGGTLGTPTASTTSFTGLTPGVYLVQLQVTDDSSAIAKDTVQITVNPPLNQPPVARAGVDQAINLPLNQVSLSGSTSTDDHNIAAYLWTKLTGPAAGTLNTPTAVNTTFTGLVQGVYTVELKVTDDSSAVSRDTVQITVNPPLNQPPVARAGADQSINLPLNQVSLSGSTSTDDHNISAYLWTKLTGPAAGTLNTPTAVNTTFTGLAQGVYTVELKVTDDSSAISRDTVQITVNPPLNQPPVARAGVDQAINLPLNQVSLSGSTSTDDHNISAYLWTKLTGPAAGTLNTPTTVNTTFTGLVQGVYTVELKVTDDSSAIARDTVQITVNLPLNQPPVANAGVDQAINLPLNQVSLSGSASTDDHNIAGYLWTKLTGPAAGTLNTPTAVNTTFTGLVQGVYTVELKVTDDSAAVSRDTVQVTVYTALNNPPVARAGADQSINLPLNQVSLSGSTSTDDHNIAAYLWTKLTGPASGTLNTPTAVNTTFTGLVQGVYTVELKVTDDSSAVSRDTVQITVNPPLNQPPVARAGADQSITLPLNQVSLSGSTSTDDHNISAYLWTKLTGPAAGTLNTPTAVNTTFTGLVQGVYTVELKVTDDSSAIARDTVQITVNPPLNQPPVARAGVDQAINLPLNQVSLSGSTSTDDHNISAYLWTKLTGPAAGTLNTPTAVNTTFTGLVQGVYTVELKVTDDSSAVSRDTVQITVNPPLNQPPVARAGADQAINLPLNQVSLSGSTSTDDHNIAGYLWTKLTGPAAGTLNTPTAVNTTFTGLVQGAYTVELKVTDDSSAISRDTVQITVNPPLNQPPVARAGVDQSINLPLNQVSLSGSTSTDDHNISAYLWTKLTGPAAGTLNTPTAVNTTFTGLVQGVYTVELKVTDDSSAVSRDTVQITVNPPLNQPPVANAGVDQAINLPLNQVSLSGSASTDDHNIAAYLWTKLTGPAAGTLNTPTAVNTTFTGLVQGVYTVELKVTDDSSAVSRDTVQITVNPPLNQPPVARAGVDQAINLPLNQVSLSGSTSTDDHNIVGYLWTKLTGPASGTLNTPTAVNTTFTGLVQGVYTVELKVTDDSSAVSRDTVQITVNPPLNQPPVARAGVDQAINLPLNQVSLSGSTSTDDHNIVGYLWTKLTGPASGTLNTPTAVNTTFTALVQGVYTVELKVTDDSSAIARDTVQITVNPPLNQPPVARAGADQSINLPLNQVSLAGSTSTDDHNIVGYLWTKLTGPASGTLNTPTAVNTTFTGLVQGVYTVELKVTDDSSAVSRDTVQINVNPPLNQPPVARAGADQSITLPLNQVSLSGSTSTDDHNISAYLWTKLTGPASGTLNTPTAVSTTFTGLVQGVYTVELKVTDDSSAIARDTVQITVYPPLNQPPVARAGADQTINLPLNQVSLSGSTSTDDHNIVGYLWTKLTGPASGTLNTPTAVNTTFTGLVQGVYTVELKVTDDSSAVSRDTVQINVNPPLNQPPVARAGADQVIITPASSVSLSGTTSTDDHNIVAYLWSKISGPVAGTLNTPTVSATTFTGLVLGTYLVQLQVTDDSGAIAKDTVQITVANQPNIPPVARAGADQSISLPVSSVSLSGSTSTDDHNIVAYKWTQLTGPAGATLTTSTAVTTTFTGLTAGFYTVELKVTDDSAAVSRDTVQVAVYSASILDPTDVVVTYNGSTTPAQPPPGVIAKWIRTVRLTNWNTDGYKCYIYNGVAFRLKFPKSYNPNVNDGKKYPMLVFYHGLGEAGPITDNEYQLYHGGDIFNAGVDNGTFDGYVLCMQSQGFWGGGHYDYTRDLINYMVIHNKLDQFQVVDHGLSAGGQGTWEMLLAYPTYISAAIPMSSVAIGYKDPPTPDELKYTQMWSFDGGQDGSPAPSTCQQVADAFTAVGAPYKMTEYPDLGHDTWDRVWTETDFWPFINRAYSANPWTLFGRTDFCPGDPINVTMGVREGYNAYQWRKNGVLIPSATTNTLNVTSIGTYDVRILRDSIWSDWSRIPVQIKTKTPTVTPPITVAGLMSKVIPAVDTPYVTLQVPANYVSYVWQKVGDTTTISTGATLSVITPGSYIAKVTEQFGCSSSFSAPFVVINANGGNKPSPAANVIVSTLSKTSLRIDWTDNPNPQFNETNYEIYRGTQSGGPYKLLAITVANVITYTDSSLNPNSKYYYVLRAVNTFSASPNSSEASGTTSSDTQAPTAPGNLVITTTGKTSISLAWAASTDDVGVIAYDVYVNGQKSFVTTQTSLTVYPLTYKQTYTFYVKARDFAGNNSAASNQVDGEPVSNGLNYKYYTFVGTWNLMPDFGTLTPDSIGIMPNVAIVPRSQDDNFAFLWEGYITIPTTGTYTFKTNSDDGSKLWLGSLNGNTSPYSFAGTPLVNNDGLHGAQDATSSAVTLTAGVYPVAVAFYEQGGDQSIVVSWKTPSSGSSYVTIPNSAFADAPAVNGQAPAAATNLVATAISYNKVGLTWTDNGGTETGFEIWRSTSSTSGFTTIGSVGANITSYVDSFLLNANTTYYYRIRAIGQFGESALTDNLVFTEANWRFNNNFIDSSGNSHSLTTTGSPTFDASNKMEGTHSLLLNGTSQSVTISNTGSFLQEVYSARSVAFWMRASSTTGSSVRTIFDIGGNDDGISLTLSNSVLTAAIAGNNVRVNITAAYTSTAWNHIAVVYGGNLLRLYINGVQAAVSSTLSFTATTTTTNGAGIGQTIGTNALNNASTTFFGGWIDNFGIYSKAMSVADINNQMNKTPFGYSFAATLALPAIPAAPTSLTATAAGPNAIQVAWTDNANNETNIQLWRSSITNTNYLLYATLPANTASYTDTGLFAHAQYFYKVRAINQGGNSAYSNEASAKAGNNKPTITQLVSRSARYGLTTQWSVSATDPDNDSVSFSIQNKPTFATLTDNGNNTATLTLNPAATDTAVYNNLKILANDGNGGKDSTIFNVTVSSNFDPVMDTVVNYTLNEGDSVTVNLHATDQNASDILTWSVNNIPSAFTLTPGANGFATLKLKPGYASSGVYTVQVSVNDGKGGFNNRQFILTVNDKDPNQKIYVRFMLSTAPLANWNNLTNPTASNLVDSYNNPTNIGINVQNNVWIVGSHGPQTGNNSGIFPDPVLLEYHYFGLPWQPQTVPAIVSGLDTSRRYSFTFYAGTIWDVAQDNGSTNFTINGQTVSLYVQNNTQNTVSLNNIKPAADGTITFTMSKGTGATVGYLNAFVMSYLYDDGTAPVAPISLTAQYLSGQGVRLAWQDKAYNETGNEIYRAASLAGPYTLVGTSNVPNASSYVDSTASGATQYYYKIRAINSHGGSAYSNIVSILTPDRVPQITQISNVILKNNQTQSINVTAIDDATDHITLTASNLPSFVTFTDNGNGTGVVNITPNTGSIGVYQNITIKAKDNSDSSRSTTFSITIIDNNMSSVYINFSDGISNGSSPWNNFTSWPTAGATMTNLVDDSNTPTTMSVSILDNFEGIFDRGMHPGNGKTVYPEVVMNTALFETSTNTKRIKISGLATSGKKYNFVLFNSHDFALNTVTKFVVAGLTKDSVMLDGTYNINKTAEVNGITPDATGSVTISMTKNTGADLALLNTIVVQSYSSALTLLSPTDLRITNITKNSLSLQWADRAFDEGGYQLYRSTDGINYSLLTSPAVNVTTYTDASLSGNTTYYYEVRAKNAAATVFSAFGTPARATTYMYNVYVQCTGVNNAPLPWNNTDAAPIAGTSWSNFKDDINQVTTSSMRITSSFSEVHPLGMNTGNNSGVYPDALLQYSYYVFPGITGGVKVSGLNLSMKYDFTFIGSSQGWGDLNTCYTVNGKPYYLNASLNIGKGTLVVYGIAPDANGEVNISVTRASTSPGGFLNAFIMSGYIPTVVNSSNGVIQPDSTGTNARGLSNNDTADTTNQAPVVVSSVQPIPVKPGAPVTAYPNPYSQAFTLMVPSSDNDRTRITILNATGQMVYDKQFDVAANTQNAIQIESNRAMMTPGIYLVRVTFMNKNQTQVLKMVRQ